MKCDKCRAKLKLIKEDFRVKVFKCYRCNKEYYKMKEENG